MIKRWLTLAVITKACVRLPAIWFERDSLALKWFLPGLRATTLPFLVILRRLVNDLFVFMEFSVLLFDGFFFACAFEDC